MSQSENKYPQSEQPINATYCPPPYPPYANVSEDDEIDLYELWQGLVEEKRTILIVLFSTILAAIGYVTLGPKTYQIETQYQKPYAKDVSTLQYPGVFKLDSGEVFSRFTDKIQQPQLVQELARDQKVASLFEPEVSLAQKEKALQKLVQVEIPEEDKKKQQSPFVTIDVDWKTADGAFVLSEVFNNIAVSQTKSQIMEDLEKSILKKLEDNQLARKLENDKIDRELKAEVKRLREADDEERRKINEQIAALRLKAKEDRLYRIKRLQVDLKAAKDLGIIDPVDPLNYHKKLGKNAQLIVDVSQRLPSGYWLGTRVLTNEIKLLKSRESDDPFIKELPGLFKRLEELKVNERIQTILSRKDNVPFSEKLRALITEKQKLEGALSYLKDMKFLVAERVTPDPVIPEEPIKPKKSLVVAVAGVLGLMLGIFIALIRRAIKNRKKSEVTELAVQS